MPIEPLIGAAAAFCTTVSYIPQLKKVWDTGETGDLSLKMLLLLLASGLALWIIYGLVRSDIVIVAAQRGESDSAGMHHLVQASRTKGSG